MRSEEEIRERLKGVKQQLKEAEEIGDWSDIAYYSTYLNALKWVLEEE